LFAIHLYASFLVGKDPRPRSQRLLGPLGVNPKDFPYDEWEVTGIPTAQPVNSHHATATSGHHQTSENIQVTSTVPPLQHNFIPVTAPTIESNIVNTDLAQYLKEVTTELKSVKTLLVEQKKEFEHQIDKLERSFSKRLSNSFNLSAISTSSSVHDATQHTPHIQQQETVSVDDVSATPITDTDAGITTHTNYTASNYISQVPRKSLLANLHAALKVGNRTLHLEVPRSVVLIRQLLNNHVKLNTFYLTCQGNA
jgi:hypothetical protein